MADDLNPLAEIDDCSFLFLIDLREGSRNSLHVQVAEGRSVGSPKSIRVADKEITDCTAIEITDESRVFEIVWNSYVGYSVLNESFATPTDEEAWRRKPIQDLLTLSLHSVHGRRYIRRRRLSRPDASLLRRV